MEVIKSLVLDYWKNVVILILLCVIGCSCSTRKVQIEKVKEETKIEQTNNIDTKIIENNESQEIEITPIDTAKVLIIDGKIYKNAKVKFVNKKAKIETVIKDKTKKGIETKKEINGKVTDRLNFSLLWFLLLIPIVIYIYAKSKI